LQEYCTLGACRPGVYTYGEGDELYVYRCSKSSAEQAWRGKGSVMGAVIGSLLMGMINNGLIIAGLSVSQQTIIRGAYHYSGCSPWKQIAEDKEKDGQVNKLKRLRTGFNRHGFIGPAHIEALRRKGFQTSLRWRMQRGNCKVKSG
jgi:hypothetical protein